MKALDIKARTINVKWKEQTHAEFNARLVVKANDRDVVLADILKTMKELKVDITEISTKVTTDRENITNLSANIKDIDTLQNVIKTLRKIDSVFDVRRIK